MFSGRKGDPFLRLLRQEKYAIIEPFSGREGRLTETGIPLEGVLSLEAVGRATVDLEIPARRLISDAGCVDFPLSRSGPSLPPIGQ